MNEIVNKFLLVSDKFMHDMHLEQPRIIYSACVPFTRNKERKETQILFTEMSLIMLVLNMIWLMANQKT